MNYEDKACSVLTNKSTMNKILCATIDAIEPSEFDCFHDFACTLIEEFQLAIEDKVAEELKISIDGQPINGKDHLYFDEIDAYIYNHDDYRSTFFDDFLRLLKNKEYYKAKSRYLECKQRCESYNGIYKKIDGAFENAIRKVNENFKIVDASLLDQFMGSPDNFIFSIRLREELPKNSLISPRDKVKKI